MAVPFPARQSGPVQIYCLFKSRGEKTIFSLKLNTAYGVTGHAEQSVSKQEDDDASLGWTDATRGQHQEEVRL